MSRPRRLAVYALSLALCSTVAACGAATQPQLKVLSMERAGREPGRNMVLFVEVVNPASRPMRLQRLQYTFASAGVRQPGGEVQLTRVVEPGAAVVVEVPVSIAAEAWSAGQRLTLAGRLYAEQDELVRSFAVTADVAVPPGFTP